MGQWSSCGRSIGLFAYLHHDASIARETWCVKRGYRRLTALLGVRISRIAHTPASHPSFTPSSSATVIAPNIAHAI